MDDLSGLKWTSSNTTNSGQKPPPMSTGSYYPTLRPTPPLSGRSTPLSTNPAKPWVSGPVRSNASTPVNDSFANLVSFNAAGSTKGLTLQEQQQRLQEERVRQKLGVNGPASGQQDEVFWEKLGSGTSTPNPVVPTPTYTTTQLDDFGGVLKEDNGPSRVSDTAQSKSTTDFTNSHDLLADFETTYHSSTVRDDAKNNKTRARNIEQNGMGNISKKHSTGHDEDDDPFGLGSMNHKPQPPQAPAGNTPDTDDDILGMLGRPVSDFSQPEHHTPPSTVVEETSSSLPADRALAELVDMGFTADKSRQALESTESGSDVQSAVGWLLNQAHQESRSQSRGRQQNERSGSQQARRSPPRKASSTSQSLQPAWMNNTAAGITQRPNSRSPVNGDKDPSQRAAELGNNLFKTANSIWKTGTKKLNQAVADFNSDSDSSQPKWMREPRIGGDTPVVKPQHQKDRTANGHPAASKPRRETAPVDPGVTDEALMLESADARPAPRKPFQSKPESTFRDTQPATLNGPTDTPVNQQQAVPRPKFMQEARSQERQDPRSRLSKQAVEEQTAEAYISPARRKKSTPKPAAPEPNLLSEAAPTPSATSFPTSSIKQPSKQPPINRTSRSLPPSRPQPPKRAIPTLSPTALQTSHSSRHAGTLAFKRGDYAEATTHYTSALAPIPSSHPLTIPILTNRALSHLKTGDPKQSIADTTTALDVIGPSRGVGETLDLGDEGRKDMHKYWTKAMTRQAEALEQLEKWADAGVVWKSCVEAGVGGATSIAGRDRCEKFVNGRAAAATATVKKPPPAAKPKPKPQPKSSALDDLTGSSASLSQPAAVNTEAVSRLRAANLAAERLDDEKFALADHVSDRVSRWRAGKEGNLRALLASLDTVLWEGSGWKKVGMGELIVGGKVKVVYMKAVGRCHPDKLPTTATTEQRMISAAVFATLNEAWDGFKRENGL
ncbi:MAG: hypothetical protein Q9222_002819 [Ikaeria aurantiellina]